MASVSPRHNDSVTLNYPRALSSIIMSVGLLAVFITLASWILLSNPIETVVQNYFYEVGSTRNVDLPTIIQGDHGGEVGIDSKLDSGNTGSNQKQDFSLPSNDEKKPTIIEGDHGGEVGIASKLDFGNTGSNQKQNFSLPSNDEKKPTIIEGDHGGEVGIASKLDFGNTGSNQKQDLSLPSNDEKKPTIIEGDHDGEVHVDSKLDSGNAGSKLKQNFSLPSDNDKKPIDDGSNGAIPTVLPESDTLLHPFNSKNSADSECDLYHGEWFYDSVGPTYTNNTCPVITQTQNCQGNGRPDKEYESWRWKPSKCELPRFNGTKFLELMSGKTIAFVGDSVARNQMESLVCLLWQVETPKQRGNRHMQRWYFRSKSVMISRVWSSWLVHHTAEPFSYVPGGVDKLHLDVPDETFMQFIPTFDVIVLSSGHWFAKQSVYMLNNEIVGAQLWSPPNKLSLSKINNIEAFGISVETGLTAMLQHPNYTGLTIVRSFSPDHYEGGAWNTGGSCTGKEKPLLPGQLLPNEFVTTMHDQQVNGLNRAIKKQTNRSKVKLMDITEIFSYRHDAHPGPYRNADPNKITKRGPDGRPPPQDCLHWCMPGAVDTWNEFVLEIIRREFEGKQNPTL